MDSEVFWSESVYQTRIYQVQKLRKYWFSFFFLNEMSQLMRLWHLSHRRPAKAQASLRICAVSPEPSLFAHIKYGSRRRVWPKIWHLAPLDICACVFEEFTEDDEKCHNLMRCPNVYFGYDQWMNIFVHNHHDITNMLTQTTNNPKIFCWSLGIWDNESGLYFNHIRMEEWTWKAQCNGALFRFERILPPAGFKP